jgi:hypothetical protein
MKNRNFVGTGRREADKIKKRLMTWCKSSNYDIVIPNFFVEMYEMDVMKLTHAGILCEYEIKVSRADFKNDFKKGYKLWKGEQKNKHESIKNGELKCNRFYFVVPENLITKDEVPEYAGLIYYYKEDYLRTIKPSKIIHHNKYNDYEKLAEKLAFRCEIYEGKVRYYKSRAKDIIETCKNIFEKNNIEIPYFVNFEL